MADGNSDSFKVELNGGRLWLHCIDEQGAPVVGCLGEASRALSELRVALARLELSQMVGAMPRGH